MISILLATRCRTDLALSVIQQIVDTTGDIPLEILIAIEEDEESLKRLSEKCTTLPERISHRISYEETTTGSPNPAWNRILPLASHDLFFLAGDDAIYRPYWLHKTLEAHDKKLNGFGFVGLYDKAFSLDIYQNVLAPTPFYDRKFCKEVLGGVCFVPHYHRYFADNENFERAKNSGRYYFEREAIVEHDTGLVPETNPTRVNKADFWGEDEATLKRRRASGFPSDYPSLI